MHTFKNEGQSFILVRNSGATPAALEFVMPTINGIELKPKRNVVEPERTLLVGPLPPLVYGPKVRFTVDGGAVRWKALHRADGEEGTAFAERVKTATATTSGWHEG